MQYQRHFIRAISLFTILIVTFVACGQTPAKEEAALQKNTGRHTDAKTNIKTIDGTVTETMDSGGYTYVLLDQKGKKSWIAMPLSKIKKGDRVSIYTGSEMMNFKSNTLNRTFEKIIFSPGLVRTNNAKTADTEATAHKKGFATTGGSKQAKVVSSEKLIIPKAEGKNGFTVAELYEKRKSLEKQKVRVHGKVMKVTRQVMNKNWVHLQDGTGDATKGTQDLVITSNEVPKKGAIVTAEGTVANDRDFGYGYTYRLLIEDATFKAD